MAVREMRTQGRELLQQVLQTNGAYRGWVHSVLERNGEPTKNPCSSRIAALGGKPRKKAKKSAKKAAKRTAAKRPAKRPAKRSAKRSAKRTAKRSAARRVGHVDGHVTTRRVGHTRHTKAKTGFAAMPKAERVRLARKGARAAAKARGGSRRRSR